MTVAFYLNIVSPHQIPLAIKVASVVGMENFIYVYLEDLCDERVKTGWNATVKDLHAEKLNDGDANLIADADLMYTGLRCLDLIKSRQTRGKRSVYYSERWFKPPLGILRMLSPGYFKMARRFSELLRNGEGLTYCPVGIHAARDMARLCGLMQGDLRCLFRAPKLEFERRPGGRIWLKGQSSVAKAMEDERRYCLDKMRMWGYFVESGKRGKGKGERQTNDKRLRVLWVGRLLKLKRVDTIIRAVGRLSTCSTCSTWLKISLDIYGTGPEEIRLKKLAAKYGDVIKFHPPLPIEEVRKLMQKHDVYVFASNGYDGWGAVVSEALEEGMSVVGTFESGASATILPKERLYHCGDVKRLVRLLENEYAGSLPACFIDKWTAEEAAKRLMKFE